MILYLEAGQRAHVDQNPFAQQGMLARVSNKGKQKAETCILGSSVFKYISQTLSIIMSKKGEKSPYFSSLSEILLNFLWQPGWEGSLEEDGYVHMYDWIPPMST